MITQAQATIWAVADGSAYWGTGATMEAAAADAAEWLPEEAQGELAAATEATGYNNDGRLHFVRVTPRAAEEIRSGRPALAEIPGSHPIAYCAADEMQEAEGAEDAT